MTDALERMFEEFSDIRQAWLEAVSGRRFDLLGLALEGLYRYCDIRCLYKVGSFLLMTALDGIGDAEKQAHALLAARIAFRLTTFRVRLNDFKTAMELMGTFFVGTSLSLPDIDRAFALSQYAMLRGRLGKTAKAKSLQERSLELYRRIADPEGIAGGLLRLGCILAWMGNWTLLERRWPRVDRPSPGWGTQSVRYAAAIIRPVY